MTTKQMYMQLVGRNSMPKGELKQKMFEFHNSYFGKSVYVRKTESPTTMCGSCIQRVKAVVWKIYHAGETRQYKELEFTGKLGIHNQPIYKLKDE